MSVIVAVAAKFYFLGSWAPMMLPLSPTSMYFFSLGALIRGSCGSQHKLLAFAQGAQLSLIPKFVSTRRLLAILGSTTVDSAPVLCNPLNLLGIIP